MATGYMRHLSRFLFAVLLMVDGTIITSAAAASDEVDLTPDGKVDKRYILSGADQEHQSPTSNWVFLLLHSVLWGCCCLMAYLHHKRRAARISTRNTMIERRRRRQQEEAAEEDFDEDARLEEVMAKFHVHQVSCEKKTDADDEESPTNDQDEKDDGKADNKERNAEATPKVPQRLSSLWNSSVNKAECSICLEGYCQLEKVCVSKNPECTHVFHQECIAEWLKRHDKCPLCRVDLVK